MEKTKAKKISIDFLKLLSVVLNDKRKMTIYCGVAAILSIIVAFSIPRIYKASVMLAPEESDNGFSGNISSLASMVGMNMKFGQSGDAIYPEIYPDAMNSTSFLTSLFDIKVTSKKGDIKDMTYREYLSKHQKTTWWSYPKEWLTQIIEKMTSDGNANDKGQQVDPFNLTKKQFDLAKSISGLLDCHVDKKTNVITITVTDQDPLIAASMAKAVTAQLQAFITEYRTNKARNDEAYMKKLYVEAEQQYTEARHKYAAFCDANTNVNLQSVKTKIDDMENDMQLKYNIYTQVVEQLQMAKAKVQERTPAFTVLQNAFVPLKHSNSPKIFILAGFVFMAFCIRMLILLKQHHQEIIIWE